MLEEFQPVPPETRKQNSNDINSTCNISIYKVQT